MTITAVVRALVEAGATPEMILAAVEAAELVAIAENEARREKARIKKQAQRRLSRGQTGTTGDGGGQIGTPPLKERSPTPPKENNPPPSLRSGDISARETPVGVLSGVLDAEHAKAVSDHRQRMRKPLTPHAAKLLAGKFAQCPDPNAAADTMIANGWQGFEPGWLESRATGPPAKRRAVNGFAAFAIDLAEQDHAGNHHAEPQERSAASGPGVERRDQEPGVLDTERPERAGGPYTVVERR